jgi:hypothetical protein
MNDISHNKNDIRIKFQFYHIIINDILYKFKIKKKGKFILLEKM